MFVPVPSGSAPAGLSMQSGSNGVGAGVGGIVGAPVGAAPGQVAFEHVAHAVLDVPEHPPLLYLPDPQVAHVLHE